MVPVCDDKACSPLLGKSSQCCYLNIFLRVFTFNVVWLTFILREGEREKDTSTTEITPANALETNRWSSSCQYAPLFFISCAVGDDRSHHHFLSLHRSRCHILSSYLFTLLLTHLRTCFKVCLPRAQSRFWRFMDP